MHDGWNDANGGQGHDGNNNKKKLITANPRTPTFLSVLSLDALLAYWFGCRIVEKAKMMKPRTS
jgi:hypothetical protein